MPSFLNYMVSPKFEDINKKKTFSDCMILCHINYFLNILN